MSPARVLETIQKENELQTLTSALDALLVTAHQLSLREQELQQRVKLAHDEYKKLANRVEGGISDVEQSVLDQIRPDDSWPLPKLDPSLKPLDVVNHLRNSGHIQRQLVDVVVAGILSSRSFGDERTDGNSSFEVTSNNPCVVAAKARRPSLYERDFTTSNGVKGTLRCPFAKPSHVNGNVNGKSANGTTTSHHLDGQSSTTRCGFDPIKADVSHQDRVSSAGASARSSAARCPIRYMNDHSPEELAKYFENHKHEIPRSHAICVTRFQRNSATMRQIDAKYGSLVNMIQGLGEKHKSLLPEAEQNGPVGSSAERVEKWAEDVSTKSPHPATLSTVDENDDAPEEVVNVDDDERMGHFERPLREVRVGESPSRPWGIPVPVLNHQTPTSVMNSPAAQIRAPELDIPKLTTESDLPSPTPAGPRGKCPFDHTSLLKQQKPDTAATLGTPAKETGSPTMYQKHHPQPPPLMHDATHHTRYRDDEGKEHINGFEEPKTSTPASPQPANNPSQMIFNGPVFFGYSAEETAALMQQLSLPQNGK